MLQDIPSERAVLAAVCQYGSDTWVDCAEIINDDCFGDHVNFCIYSCLKNIFKNNSGSIIDLASIMSAAQDIGLQAELANEVKYIKALFNFHVEQENTLGFAKKIRKLSEFRQLIAAQEHSANAIKQLTGNEPLSEAIALVEKPIFDFSNKLTIGNQQTEQIGTGLDDYFLKLQDIENLQGVSIGCPIYERVVGGIKVGVHIKGARNKTGKSFDALNAACYCSAIDKNPVLYMDTELRLSQGQWDRFLARFANGVTINEIKYGSFLDDEDKIKKVTKSKNILKKIPLYYTNVTGKNIDEITSIIRRWLVQQVGYDSRGQFNKCLVVYDYLKPPTNAGDLKNIQEYQEIGLRLEALHNTLL